MPVTMRRVVCAFGETMAIFSPISLLSRLDLPVFGRPAIATVPQRNAVMDSRARALDRSGLDLLEEAGRRLLLGAPPRTASSRRAQAQAGGDALDLEFLLVGRAGGRDDAVFRELLPAALQQLLQAGLGVLRRLARVQLFQRLAEGAAHGGAYRLVTPIQEHRAVGGLQGVGEN